MSDIIKDIFSLTQDGVLGVIILLSITIVLLVYYIVKKFNKENKVKKMRKTVNLIQDSLKEILDEVIEIKSYQLDYNDEIKNKLEEFHTKLHSKIDELEKENIINRESLRNLLTYIDKIVDKVISLASDMQIVLHSLEQIFKKID